ncbi:SDR family oxidoreductase [uncultured Roseobacter sp.]|uniref:SDR family oxidoreductase n=1 Tax=uncultured Roseobacter sp. TaxID=114847 RepID=UPI0026311CD5|nr:SDR family oxidoreductase [uncultured Roseobacter sp.]
MEFDGKTIVITGGASGIGAALARALQAKGARVAIADRDAATVRDAAEEIGCLGLVCDVTVETEIEACVRDATTALGRIDVFVSNAGIFAGQSGHAASASDDVWMQNWMAHVYAARCLLPDMLARGVGYFVNVSSAAGLLNQIGDAAYSATKHAAVSFAESLAISHGAQGIGVSVVCPQYVATPLIGMTAPDADARPGLLTAEEVAQSIIAGVEGGQFLILPHAEVAQHAQRRAQDHDRWIDGMRRLQQKSVSELGDAHQAELYRLN